MKIVISAGIVLFWVTLIFGQSQQIKQLNGTKISTTEVDRIVADLMSKAKVTGGSAAARGCRTSKTSCLQRRLRLCTGVLPEFRGKGLTAGMYERIMPRLKAASIKSQTLEVICENTTAIKVYQGIGMPK